MQKSELARQQRCVYCHEEQDAGHRFCHRCGGPLLSQRPGGSNRLERMTPWVLIAILGLAIVVAVLAVTTLEPSRARFVREMGVTQISVNLAHDKARAGNAIFVDVREAEDYEAAHIPDAILLPLHELAVEHEILPHATEIIVYDGGSDRDLSIRATHLLLDLGYEEVVVLQGGFAAWQEAGYPVNGRVAVKPVFGSITVDILPLLPDSNDEH